MSQLWMMIFKSKSNYLYLMICFVTDRLMDERPDTGDFRVAFITENLVKSCYVTLEFR